MGCQIFIQAHLKSNSQEIPIEKILDYFGIYIISKGTKFIDLVFGQDDSRTIYLDTDVQTINYLMVSRPWSNIMLAECLFNIMCLGNFVLFEPGRKYPIVLKKDALSHIPKGMINSLGNPRIERNLKVFLRLYGKL